MLKSAGGDERHLLGPLDAMGVTKGVHGTSTAESRRLGWLGSARISQSKPELRWQVLQCRHSAALSTFTSISNRPFDLKSLSVKLVTTTA